jgi:muramoyltetrapeptide carboxypeptidase
LLDEIPWDQVVKARPVIGFSDATALLLALARRGIESIHGPVLTSLADGLQGLTEASLQAMIALLLSGEPTFLPGIPLGGPAAVVEGPVIGGNLAVLASLAGTVHALQASGSILVLEDVGESPYRIERLLCQLIDSGALVGVKGIALGEFTGCQPPDGANYQLSDVFLEHLQPLNIPVLHQLPVGHGQRNIAFPYGRTARMDVLGIRFTSTTSAEF